MIVEVDDDTFRSRVLDRVGTTPIVVLFVAEWSAASQGMIPVLTGAVDDEPGNIDLAIVDVDRCPAVVEACRPEPVGLEEVPMALGLAKGHPFRTFIGVQDERATRAFVHGIVALSDGTDEELAPVLIPGRSDYLPHARTLPDGTERRPRYSPTPVWASRGYVGYNRMTLDDVVNDPDQPWWWRKIVGPFISRVNDELPESYQTKELHRSPSVDWCRFRRDSHCYFPDELDADGSREAGYNVWIPIDRGPCPWASHPDQRQKCEVSEPGPTSGEKAYAPDATYPWSMGGQRFDRRY